MQLRELREYAELCGLGLPLLYTGVASSSANPSLVPFLHGAFEVGTDADRGPCHRETARRFPRICDWKAIRSKLRERRESDRRGATLPCRRQ
jgi:hypothetical protein